MPHAHPIISYFGRRGPGLPRILVIGREPNDNIRVGGHAGPYDLRGSSASQTTFWTWSHKAIERAAGISGLRLWHVAKATGGSPIEYADASPVGNKVGGNGKKPQVTPKELESHAKRFIDLLRRESCSFPVVVVSGRRRQDSPFFEKVLPFLKERGSIVVEVPFFGRAPGSTREALAGPLCDPRVQPAIKKIVEAWLADDRRQSPVRRGGKLGTGISWTDLRAATITAMRLLQRRRA